jgi:hypothetical protein
MQDYEAYLSCTSCSAGLTGKVWQCQVLQLAKGQSHQNCFYIFLVALTLVSTV